MKKYTFLLLAFFLSFNLFALGLGVLSSISAVKETSPRNSKELGNISESTQRSQQPGPALSGADLAARKTKTASINISCKTYEGKIYNNGEAGYNDCIRTIKTDRQSEKQVP